MGMTQDWYRSEFLEKFLCVIDDKEYFYTRDENHHRGLNAHFLNEGEVSETKVCAKCKGQLYMFRDNLRGRIANAVFCPICKKAYDLNCVKIEDAFDGPMGTTWNGTNYLCPECRRVIRKFRVVHVEKPFIHHGD